VSRQQQHAAPSLCGALIILQAIVLDETGYVFGSDPWELRELSQQPPEIVEDTLERCSSPVRAHFGHRKREVSFAHSQQASMQPPSGPSYLLANKDRGIARQQT
jgi:hypothetical protein